MEHVGRELTVLVVGEDRPTGERVAASFDCPSGEPSLDVVSATETTAAIDELERGADDIDCVALGGELSERDTLGLLAAVREEWSTLPVVLLDAADADDVGADDTDDPAPPSIPADDLPYLVEFQSVVLDTSTSLMSAELDELDTKIQWALQSVAEFAGLDRCYTFETDGHAPPELRHEWRRDEAVPSPPDVIDSWSADEQLCTRLSQFENIALRDVTDTFDGPAGGLATELFADSGAVVLVPLVSEWEFRGFAGFEVVGSPRAWTDAELSILRTVADTVAHTLERQQHERTLRRQNDRLDTFAATVSHDLRNPLNVAAGFVDVARETGDVSRLDRAAAALDRMDAIVEDVLELAREGRTVGDTTAVDLVAVVEEAWLAVETGDATLEVDTLDPGTVSADPDRLPAVFENLFRNAVEHSSTGPRSQARAEPDDAVEHGSTGTRSETGDDSSGGSSGGTVVRVGSLADATGFFVEDDGPGIPSEERDRVFEEGYSTGDDGSGLGLGIVADVVDAHGWTIDVTSSASGGARFEVVTEGQHAAERRSRATTSM